VVGAGMMGTAFVNERNLSPAPSFAEKGPGKGRLEMRIEGLS